MLSIYAPIENQNSKCWSVFEGIQKTWPESTQIVNNTENLVKSPALFWGLVNLNSDIIHQLEQNKQDYYFTDTPYFGRFDNQNLKKDNHYWRFSKNNIHAKLITGCPADRFEKFNVKFEDNTTSRSHILICPSMLNSKDGVVLPTLPQWLHHRFAPKYDKPNKKVYIDRKYSPSRRLTNAEELMIALKGFEVQNLEDLSIKDQMKLFASATPVVSTHGAGLVNLLWCKKNTKVIEITHEDSNKKVYPGLSLHLQLKHKVLVGQKIPIPMDSPEKKLHRLNDYNDIKLDSKILLLNLE